MIITFCSDILTQRIYANSFILLHTTANNFLCIVEQVQTIYCIYLTHLDSPAKISSMASMEKEQLVALS